MRVFGLFAVVIMLGTSKQPGLPAASSVSTLEYFRGRQHVVAGPAVRLARDAVSSYLRTGRPTAPTHPLPPEFARKAGVFVTISRHGRRRGCWGRFEPATGCLRDEIIGAAVAAATSDPRCRPIRLGELKDLEFTVSIVGPLRRTKDTQPYSPGAFGLLLRSGEKTGVILPGEARTSRWRLAEAKRQAGVSPGEPYELYVFETVALRAPEATRCQR